MNKYLMLFIALLLFYNCTKQTKILKEFDCRISNFTDLEEIKDVKNMFSIQIPKNWKTNLYQDEIQSSIFTADTTKQLTETTLLDVTFIKKQINFNEVFKLKQEQENLSKGYIRVKHKEFNFKEKEAYFTLSKGKKGDYPYQIFKNFIKINNQNFVLIKVEIYGDSITNKRFCKALKLMNNIKIVQ
jgi:hypothetical protein